MKKIKGRNEVGKERQTRQKERKEGRKEAVYDIHFLNTFIALKSVCFSIDGSYLAHSPDGRAMTGMHTVCSFSQ